MNKAVTTQELYNEMRREEKKQGVRKSWDKRAYHRKTAELAIKCSPKNKVSH